MSGEPFKRCSCKDANRRNLYGKCPRLIERSHGAWYFRYSEPTGPDGKRRQPLVGPFPSKTAAVKEQVERQDRMGKGLPTYSDRSLKLAEDFDRWCEARTHLSARTRSTETEIGKLYLKPGLGHVLLADLRPHHLEDLYTAIRRIGRTSPAKRDAPAEILQRLLEARADGASSRRPISNSRLRRIHDVIRAYLGLRGRQEVIPRNPASNIHLPVPRRPEPLVWSDERVERWLRAGRRPSAVMIWTPEQTGQFLDFAAEDRNYALWHLIAFRGLRRGEAVDLDRSELNLRQAKVTIRTSHRDGEDEEIDTSTAGQATTKTRRSRTIGLDRLTVHVLTTHRRHQLEQQANLGNLYEDSGLVFTDELGRQLVLKSVSQQFDRLVARYEKIRQSPGGRRGRGVASTPLALSSSFRMPTRAVELALNGPPLPPIRLHDLRHGAASLTYQVTKDLKLVSTLLGHSGIQITADTYTTLFQEVDAAAAEAVTAIVPRNHALALPEEPSEVDMTAEDDQLAEGDEQ